jgi:hypothetical protein
VPLHVGAAGFHLFKGQNLFTRVNPLYTLPPKAA